MGMPALAHRWTRDEVLALPEDGKKYELIDGELLVSPAARPLHQIGVTELFRPIDAFVHKHRIGYALCVAADLAFHGDQLLQPDIFVTSFVNDRLPKTWEEYGIPLLIVEVVSPSTRRRDHITKRRFYQRAGVSDYWIVDLEARSVDVWHPASTHPEVMVAELRWAPLGTPEHLAIDLHAYFREVWSKGR